MIYIYLDFNYSNIEQRVAIFQLILDNDTNGLKDGLVLLVSMTEARPKSLEGLESPIEVFMTGTGTTLEFSHRRCIQWVSNGTHGILVHSVGNDLFACRHSTLQSIRCFEHGEIIRGGPLWSFNPCALVAMDGESNLVAQSWTGKLFRIPILVW